MARRPGNLNLNDARNAPKPDNISPHSRFHLDLPSPRVGEVPPALSPLDAFAQQSRMLAKRFEESQQKGRRISRLDHLEIASEFSRKPSYFRSVSGSTLDDGDRNEDVFATPDPIMRTPNLGERPTSHYPRLSNPADNESKRNTLTNERYYDAQERTQAGDSYFGVAFPRAASPEPFDPRPQRNEYASPTLPSLTSSVDSVTSSQSRTNTDDSVHSQRSRQGLAPPRSPHHHPLSATSNARCNSTSSGGSRQRVTARSYHRSPR